MDETFIALRDKPCKATVQALLEKTVQNVKAGGCQGCAPKIADGMRDLLDLFARKIEETVSQVNYISQRFLREPDDFLDRSS